MADQKPILEDPTNEKEIFASEVAGVGFVHGNIVITFANIRFDEPVGGQPPKIRRFVASRVALTNIAAAQLRDQLKDIANRIEAATAKSGDKPN